MVRNERDESRCLRVRARRVDVNFDGATADPATPSTQKDSCVTFTELKRGVNSPRGLITVHDKVAVLDGCLEQSRVGDMDEVL